MLSRRHVLTGSAALLGLTACRQNAGVIAGGEQKIDKLGIQTYTLREIFEPDPQGTLNLIKSVGYDYVELNRRNFAERSPQELADMVKRAGLYSPATHSNYNDIKADPKAVVEICKTLGCKFAIIPWMDEDVRTADDWKRHATVMNEAGKVFADSGMALAYHNHQFEFDDLGGGVTAMQILLENTNPDLVDFQLDIFWAKLASIDISALFAAHPNRFKLCHIKDMKGDPKAYVSSRAYEDITKELMVNVGEGNIDFPAIFRQNQISGMEYFIAEHDSPVKPFRDAIATSHDAIRNMRF